MTLLRADRLQVSYPDHTQNDPLCVLQAVSFAIGKGEIVGLTGVSGSGKTTLLRTLAGLISPTGGHVEWADGKQGQIAFCPQDDILLPYRSVWENAVLLLESHRTSSRALDASMNFVSEALLDLTLSEHQQHAPGELSGGMRQRLQFIQVLASPCELLLLDEPFSQQDLDSLHRLENISWQRLRKEHRSALIVSHDVDTLGAICDRVLFLGGTPATLVSSRDTPPELRQIGGANRRKNATYEEFSQSLWMERRRATSA